MDIGPKPLKIRLISGPPHLVDAQVNELLGEYAIVSLNFAAPTEGVVVTAYLVLQSELRMMQIASAGPVPNGRRS